MRGITLISSGLALLAFNTPALGQADRTQEIICELTGDCGGPVEAAEADRADKGETAGFSFTRPGTKGASAPATARSGGQRTSTAAYVPAARTVKATKAKAYRGAAQPTRSASEMRVTFALGSAEVLPTSRVEIEAFVKALQSPALAGKRFRVEGHTDASGAPEINERLSQERADAVAALLKAQGIGEDRIEAKGFGFAKPLPGQGRLSAKNRRVELVPVGS